MNYQKHYNLLVNKAQARILKGYVEKHHILPKCLGGGDEITNLVVLTPEEHFVAHQLLIKIYPNEPKLVFAVHMMCNGNDKIHRNNKMYGWLRKKCNEALSINKRNLRKKETKPRKKRVLSEEHKLKIGLAGKGKTHNEETKLKIGAAHKNKTLSEETKQKMRKPKTNRGPVILEYFDWSCLGCGTIVPKRNLSKNREQKYCSSSCFYHHKA